VTDRQHTKTRLIDAAYRLARSQGFDRTSISELIAEAGVQRGSLYHYFPGKDDLGLAVLERDRSEFMAMLASTLSPSGDPTRVLHAFFDAALTKHRETGFVGGCLWGNTALEMSDTKPAYAKLVAEVFNEWHAKVEAVIRRGQDDGAFRADVTAGDLAQLVVSGMEGGIMMSRLTKSPKPFKACLDSLKKLLCERTNLDSKVKEAQ
jgi:TetR/AcrR family transcriptional repressor of nem operon